MAAKKPVKKASAKAPAKKASAKAPAKKASSSGDSKGGTGYKDLDSQIEAVWARRGNKPLFDPKASSRPSDRARDSIDFREINRIYDRAKQRDAASKASRPATGGAAASRGRGSGSSAMSRTFGRLGGGLRGMGK